MRAMLSRTSLASALLCVAYAVPVLAQTRTYTTNADFDTGVLNNTRHVPDNQVVLGRTPVSKTRLVWVSNTVPGWIVRIDTTTGWQTARFDSALVSINGQPTGAPATGNNPGRVAVDTNGDVWIVNRAYYEGAKQGSLSKFSGDIAHCIDRNNDGVIQTSRDVNGDHIVDPYRRPGLVPADQVEYYGQDDECILTTIKIGAVGDIPRAVAVDKKGKIWVGTWQGHTVYRFNPNEPVALEASRVITTAEGYPFDAFFYSAATADDYIYFTSNPNWQASGVGRVVRINIDNLNDAQYVTCSGGSGGSVYGIVAVPGTHKAWAGAYNGSGVWKVDFDANPPTCTWINVPGQTTAMTLDLSGNVWVAGYGTNNVYKLDSNGTLLATCPTGGVRPHGLSVDFDGYIWSVQDNPWHLVRFSPTETTNNCGRSGPYPIDRASLPVPSGQPAYDYTPYLYSDFTGTQIDRQAPYARVGSWDAVYDSGAVGMPWQQIWWNSEPQGAVPLETSMVISVRAANTMAALGQAAYKQVANGASLAGTVGRYIQVKADLVGPGYKTPVLSDLSIKGPCDTVNQTCCITAADCDDGNVCTADICPAPGGACTHQAIPQCCVTNADCNDGNQCTTDTCPAPGGLCTHAPVPNCCMSYADCDDGDLCTADICPSPGGVCGNPTIPGCCHTTADCDDGNLCTTDVCPADGELCVHKPIAHCCVTDADCTDNNLCTTDKCDQGTQSCTNELIAGCCNQDSECFDGDVCTTDRCSGLGGQCVFDVKPGCCTDASPEVGQPCDEPVAPNNHAPCAPGHLVCVNNAFECEGAVKPEPERCDWVDNDCDGNIDAPNACPVGKTCVNGVCVVPCGSGEFPCEAGYQCVSGLCLPTSCDEVICQEGYTCVTGLCVSGDGGTAGMGGSGGVGGSGPGGAGGQGAFAGMGGGPGVDAGAPDGSAGSGGSAADDRGTYGLSTGGGGCRCAAAGAADRAGYAWAGLVAAACGAAVARRRRTDGGKR
jgi:streptogramin lyase